MSKFERAKKSLDQSQGPEIASFLLEIFSFSANINCKSVTSRSVEPPKSISKRRFILNINHILLKFDENRHCHSSPSRSMVNFVYEIVLVSRVTRLSCTTWTGNHLRCFTNGRSAFSDYKTWYRTIRGKQNRTINARRPSPSFNCQTATISGEYCVYKAERILLNEKKRNFLN